jgi:alpha-ketoglutarate-dependent taurine dioxygenase
MTPVMADGERALSVFSRAKWTKYIEEVHWIPGKVTVIDNWRVLHGRGASDFSESDRTLLRVSIR